MAPDGTPLDTPLPGAITASSPTLARALGALYARAPLGMRLGLAQMRDACARAGRPEDAFTVAHVAGTNGKGSTCAMVEAMARAAGKKTGLYTSPHLARFAERIRIDGSPIDDEALAEVLDRALEIGPDLSFFEAATLAAFLAFRDRGVEIAVIEVGIGGRLDATNVIASPRVTAVTRVAFDHTDRLGDTLEQIAREKAGIAKHGAPIVLGPMAPEVRAAALDVALAAGALPIVMGDDPDALPPGTSLSLSGPYQLDNARIAWRIARELGIPEAARREGLASTAWPGRFEELVIADGKLRGTWLLDGAHNPDGARALVSALASLDGAAPGAVVFGALADKAWPEMLDILAEVDATRFYVAPRGRAATPPSDLAAHAPGIACTSLAAALARAQRAGRGRVLVCGSLYLVGEARALLTGSPLDPPIAL